MAFLTRSMPRRTVLKGLGTTMALPFLEAMLPPGLHLSFEPLLQPVAGIFPHRTVKLCGTS